MFIHFIYKISWPLVYPVRCFFHTWFPCSDSWEFISSHSKRTRFFMDKSSLSPCTKCSHSSTSVLTASSSDLVAKEYSSVLLIKSFNFSLKLFCSDLFNSLLASSFSNWMTKLSIFCCVYKKNDQFPNKWYTITLRLLVSSHKFPWKAQAA